MLICIIHMDKLQLLRAFKKTLQPGATEPDTVCSRVFTSIMPIRRKATVDAKGLVFSTPDSSTPSECVFQQGLGRIRWTTLLILLVGKMKVDISGQFHTDCQGASLVWLSMRLSLKPGQTVGATWRKYHEALQGQQALDYAFDWFDHQKYSRATPTTRVWQSLMVCPCLSSLFEVLSAFGLHEIGKEAAVEEREVCHQKLHSGQSQCKGILREMLAGSCCHLTYASIRVTKMTQIENIWVQR